MLARGVRGQQAIKGVPVRRHAQHWKEHNALARHMGYKEIGMMCPTGSTSARSKRGRVRRALLGPETGQRKFAWHCGSQNFVDAVRVANKGQERGPKDGHKSLSSSDSEGTIAWPTWQLPAFFYCVRMARTPTVTHGPSTSCTSWREHITTWPEHVLHRLSKSIARHGPSMSCAGWCDHGKQKLRTAWPGQRAGISTRSESRHGKHCLGPPHSAY